MLCTLRKSAAAERFFKVRAERSNLNAPSAVVQLMKSKMQCIDIGLRQVCVFIAALAELCSGDSSNAVSEAISAGHKLLAANFVYGASHTFDQIIYTGACFVHHPQYTATHHLAWRARQEIPTHS